MVLFHDCICGSQIGLLNYPQWKPISRAQPGWSKHMSYIIYIYILKYLAKSLSILNSELVVWNSELVVFHPSIFPYVWTSQGFSKVKIICLLKSAKTKKLVLASGSQTWPANKKKHLFGKFSNFHLDYIFTCVYIYIYCVCIYIYISIYFIGFPINKT